MHRHPVTKPTFGETQRKPHALAGTNHKRARSYPVSFMTFKHEKKLPALTMGDAGRDVTPRRAGQYPMEGECFGAHPSLESAAHTMPTLREGEVCAS